MVENVAILVGNSQYRHLSNLDCCANDVAKVSQLLSASDKFHQIIELIDRPLTEVKDAMRSLASAHENLGEIFFYFSGHGLSNEDDFFMCFQDFKDSSPNSTGLSRSDAFDLLRACDAGLSVVVIDACEAGRNLIKADVSPLGRELKRGFRNFVQFSSCVASQYSLAGNVVSLFTNEFVKACLQKEQGVIYYSDIENALRDAFLDHPSQTPHFIRQGTSQEKFCDDASRLAGLRDEYRRVHTVAQNSSHQPSAQTAFEDAKASIESIDQRVPSKEQAQKFVDEVFAAVLNNNDETSDILEFFEIRTVQFDHFRNVQNRKSVSNLLANRGGSDSFVESHVEKRKRRDPFAPIALQAYMPEEYDEICKIFNHCGLTSVHVGIYFEPKFMALSRVYSEIVFLPRLTECLILTCETKEKRSGWGTFNEYEGTKNWSWSHHNWTDDPKSVALNYVTDPYKFARSYILSFNKADKSQKSDT